MNYPEIRLLIDGQWVEAERRIPVLNPATEQVVGHVPHAAAEQVAQALAAAQRGLQVWKRTSVAERTRILLKAAQLLREREA